MQRGAILPYLQPLLIGQATLQQKAEGLNTRDRKCLPSEELETREVRRTSFRLGEVALQLPESQFLCFGLNLDGDR